jgi:hypothetical protein
MRTSLVTYLGDSQGFSVYGSCPGSPRLTPNSPSPPHTHG